jgi:membrane protein implicated in regulation of membrane protease activity
MNQGPFRQRDALPPGAGGGPGPIASALGAITGAVLFVAAIIAGGFLLLIVLAAGIAMASVIGIRIWWWRRKLERDLRDRSDPQRSGAGPERGGAETIDGEFTVIVEDSDEPRN